MFRRIGWCDRSFALKGNPGGGYATLTPGLFYAALTGGLGVQHFRADMWCEGPQFQAERSPSSAISLPKLSAPDACKSANPMAPRE